jgi:2-polyprenyl-3-methyl-5-hydroxy-6-metoxy-1,4-benzoquinol methylase
VLSKMDHAESNYYVEREAQQEECYETQAGTVETPRLYDNVRRGKAFGPYVAHKRWLDVGCGLGGALDEMAGTAVWACGLEINKQRQDIVQSKGHNCVASFHEIESASVDVVTLFHVLEHIVEPIEILRQVKRILRPSGIVIIEVPHARDALFDLYGSEPFKNFTFWSEHLVLHTRQSLIALVHEAGFKGAEVTGIQRYPLSNHLHWLSKGRPGGHEVWHFLGTEQLDLQYQASLANIDATDTLIALCKFGV